MLNFGTKFGGKGNPTTYELQAPATLVGAATYPPAEVVLDWTEPLALQFPIATYIIARDGVEIANVGNVLTYSDDTGLLPDTAYKYEVVARDTEGNTSKTPATVNVAIPNLVLLPAPTNFDSNQKPNTQLIVLEWDEVVQGSASFDIDSYNIYRDSVLIDNVGPAVITYNDSPLMIDNKEYVYCVESVDTNGNKGGLTQTTTRIAPYVVRLRIGIQGKLSSYTRGGEFRLHTDASTDIADALVYQTDFSLLNQDNLDYSNANRDNFLRGLNPSAAVVPTNQYGWIDLDFAPHTLHVLDHLTIQGRTTADSTQFRMQFYDNLGTLVYTRGLQTVRNKETWQVDIDTIP